MYAIMGITGKVGGAAARSLLRTPAPAPAPPRAPAGMRVRAILRDAGKAAEWTAAGCEVALADVQDTRALELAFRDVEGVFVMLPPTFDPTPGFTEARAAIDSIKRALEQARPPKVVCLSTIGADASQPNLLNQLGLLEQALSSLSLPVTFLRPTWFLDNAAFDLATARSEGRIDSFLQPLDKLYSMVAAQDVGLTAAQLLRETWSGHRVVELTGPAPVTPNQIAQAFSTSLGKPVVARVVPRQEWDSLFRSQGMRNPTPRMQMLDGFNEGWIRFAQEGRQARRGTITLQAVVKKLT